MSRKTLSLDTPRSKSSPKEETLKSSPQYQKSHQNMLIIPPNAGHEFAALRIEFKFMLRWPGHRNINLNSILRCSLFWPKRFWPKGQTSEQSWSEVYKYKKCISDQKFWAKIPWSEVYKNSVSDQTSLIRNAQNFWPILLSQNVVSNCNMASISLKVYKCHVLRITIIQESWIWVIKRVWIRVWVRAWIRVWVRVWVRAWFRVWFKVLLGYGL